MAKMKSKEKLGVCAVCGKSTKLNIHQNCGQTNDMSRKKVIYKQNKARYKKSDLTYLVNL